MFNNKLKLTVFLSITFFALTGCVGDEKTSSEAVSEVSISKNSSEGASKTEDLDVGSGMSKNNPEGYGQTSSPWSFKKSKDLIHGSKSVYQNISSNMIDINYIFTEMILIIAEKPNSVVNGKRDYEVSLKVESGRFFCNKPGACSIKVKMGDKEKVYEYVVNNSRELDVIVIKNRHDFMDNLLKVDKISIEAEFYENGRRQFEFDVSGFPGEINASNDLEIFSPSKDNDKLW